MQRTINVKVYKILRPVYAGLAYRQKKNVKTSVPYYSVAGFIISVVFKVKLTLNQS